MTLFLCFVASLFLTIVLMPVLIRFAAPLGLLDPPGDRKVHRAPVPRCGGVALAVGAVFGASVWIEIDTSILACLAGLALVTLIGIWDDRKALGYLPKLIGQIAAATILVVGGISLDTLPLLGLDISAPWLSAAVTVLFVVAVTNAINLSDGLDGLAAGSALLSLAVIAVLALPSDGTLLFILIASLTGGIFGFLRFNTFPAIVFLGDGGSYFLGFSIAALTVLLISDVNTGISPALFLIIPGLPLVDLIWVSAERLLNGKSPFAADAGHFHHKLLGLGFSHHTAVGIYYLLHAMMGLGAYLLAYEADWGIIAIYFLSIALVIGTYHLFRTRQLRLATTLVDMIRSIGPAKREVFRQSRYIDLVLSAGFAAFVVLLVFNINAISVGIAILPILLAALVAASLMRHELRFDTVVRFCIHISTIIIVYLSCLNEATSWYPVTAQYIHLAAMLVLMVLSIRADMLNQFRLTTFDTLLIIGALVSPAVVQRFAGDFPVTEFVVKTALLLYIAEYLFRGETAWPRTLSRLVTTASLCLGLVAVSYKGLVAL